MRKPGSNEWEARMHKDLMKALGRKLWLVACTAEEARARNAQQRKYMRSAAWCVVLALLGLMGEA